MMNLQLLLLFMDSLIPILALFFSIYIWFLKKSFVNYYDMGLMEESLKSRIKEISTQQDKEISTLKDNFIKNQLELKDTISNQKEHIVKIETNMKYLIEMLNEVREKIFE